ncbi:TRAP transporter substrate-binding protein DctP [uncultured Sneathiella sp.]|uniref:TRAP transporter substrate-binding protein n=1 Tax=uncultured Sneathiella sp. TaxID=879315 RepID=UPI0030D8FF73|tara:strand:- start:16282 stop:17313 length:1032 start_codon:yes stop_codon:yes gene_type:complete
MLVRILFALALISPLATIQVVAAEEYPELSFTYAHIVPSNHTLAKFDRRWTELVTKRSGGKIKFKMFWAGSMGGPTEIPDLVSSGALDFGSTALGYLPSEFPLAGVVGNMQRTFATPSDAHEASMDIFDLPAVDEELKKHNLLILNTTTANPYNLTCTKPITNLEEMKGTRVRANGKYPPIFFNSLGMSPQTMSFAEMYEGLEKGLIDCSWMSHDLAISSKLYEVAKYAIDLNLGAVPATQLLTNRTKFEKLPKNVQTLMKEAAHDSSVEEAKYLKEVFDRTINVDMPENNMTYVHFEDVGEFKKIEPDMPKIWADDTTEAGMPEPAKEIYKILEDARSKLVN